MDDHISGHGEQPGPALGESSFRKTGSARLFIGSSSDRVLIAHGAWVLASQVPRFASSVRVYFSLSPKLHARDSGLPVTISAVRFSLISSTE